MCLWGEAACFATVGVTSHQQQKPLVVRPRTQRVKHATTSKINEPTTNCCKMTQVCRTCLEEITDRSFLSLNDASNCVKKALAVCVPELDLSLVPQAAVCIYCARALHAAFDFKQRCLQSEEKIRTHMRGRKRLDLDKIKQETKLDINFQMLPGPGIGLEVIYIRDDGSLDLGNREGELIVGDVHEPEQPQPRVEPVKMFLNASHDLSSQVLAGGLLTTNNTTTTTTTTHNLIKKRKYIKEEPKSFYNGNEEHIIRSYDCPHCSFSAKSAYLLKQHVKSHNILKNRDLPMHAANGETTFKCSICDFTTDNRFKLSHHVRAHTATPLMCPCCAFQTNYKVALHNHMKSHSLVPPTAIKKEPKTYKCKQCTFETLQKQVWLHHIDSHEREKNLKCTSCSYVASNLTTFQRHLSSHTLAVKKPPIKIAFKTEANFTSKNQPFNCPSCSYVASNKHRLAAHVLIHTGEKPFECHLCKYRANQKGHLDKHLQNHTGERLWKCSQCSYNVNTQFHLSQHMKVHNDGGAPSASSFPKIKMQP